MVQPVSTAAPSGLTASAPYDQPRGLPGTKRAHFKSRNGCLECRRRRIRCDETKPKCMNCARRRTKGSLALCSYGVKPNATSLESTAGLSLKETIDLIENLPLDIGHSMQHLPDLKGHARALIAHSLETNSVLTRSRAHQLTFGATLYPEYLRLAEEHELVRDALCVYSASHLSGLTNRSKALTYSELYFRSRTIAGLRSKLDNFDPKLIDSYIAASLLLSWTASDCEEYAVTMQGVQTLLRQAESSRRGSSIKSCFNTLPPGKFPENESFDFLLWLHPALVSLQNLEHRLAHDPDVLRGVQEVHQHLKDVRRRAISKEGSATLQQHFRMRNWLNWVPRGPWLIEQLDVALLLFLAHYEMSAIATMGLSSKVQDSLAMYKRAQIIINIHAAMIERGGNGKGAKYFSKDEIEELVRIPLEYSKHYRWFHESAQADSEGGLRL